MIYDREYFNRAPKKSARDFFGSMGAVKFLILANIAFFLLDLVIRNFTGSDVLARYFALSLANLSDGKVWTLFTYSLLHEGFLHIGVNCLVLYFAGSALELKVGPARTLFIYAASVFGGALVFLLSNLLGYESLLIGASGGAIGLLSAFLMMSKNEVMTFIIFVFPVRIRAWTMLKFMSAFEFFGFIFFELAPFSRGGIGFSAHLGGIAAGCLCAVLMSESRSEFFKISNFKFPKKRSMGRASDYKFKVDISSEENLRAEVDRILDKVNRQGFYSLTDEEKEILSEANKRM